MGEKLRYLKYLLLSFTGVTLLSGALLDMSMLPASRACGSNPSCPDGTYSVTSYGCEGSCSCRGWLTPGTCFFSMGTCNNDPQNRIAYFTHCYQGGCCCASGNCAGQGGVGGGGGGGGHEDGSSCYTDWDCDFGYHCGDGFMCEEDAYIN
jgi:hypothetical protein